MKITWLGHASFLIESGDLRIITDPFDPGNLNLSPITEPADIVVRSSDNDVAHCHVDSIPPPFDLITATEIEGRTKVVRGIRFSAIGGRESLQREGGSRDNAMYRFSVEGINIAHMGDEGNRLSSSQLDFLEGIDLLFALAGGHPTIDLDDLQEVIRRVGPRIVIPMHFRVPGPRFFMLPVTEFTQRYSPSQVRFRGQSSLELAAENLPSTLRIEVLEAAKVFTQ